MSALTVEQLGAVNRAFTRQSGQYDDEDGANEILQAWRKQVYQHANRYLSPNGYILELNAGTGIDALNFVKRGHRVHATDLSDGMIQQIQQKISKHSLQSVLTCQQCSFENLSEVKQRNFDYIFSNFGGLNCTPNLSLITQHFPSLLKPGGYVTVVIMPRVCPWELLSGLKGNRGAFRRLKNGGVKSHLEGEYFQTYYYSLRDVIHAFGNEFKLLKAEGLGSLSPPPSKEDFPSRYPGLYKLLLSLDSSLNTTLPFNRWADHLILTFQFQGRNESTSATD